ncbi:hypothetical protein Cch01nite_18530 [Cellulomonas chitinilytica]|uniref:Uncharacterized protein n=1 Tax=Cellulomonas chitinilytica TaxID=398759 RepID=A0A919U2H9_9CELL|nr:hypothetical protein Cch01nite_18530 [Cellulomonas chitinilytica]
MVTTTWSAATTKSLSMGPQLVSVRMVAAQHEHRLERADLRVAQVAMVMEGWSGSTLVHIA